MELSSKISTTGAPIGLTEILPSRGRSKTLFTLNYLKDLPLPLLNLFISDEGIPYPNALTQFSSLHQLIVVKTDDSDGVWRTGLEAIQTGLFQNIVLRPSGPCAVAHLRRLQIHAERTRTKVFLLPPRKLPHWMIRRGPTKGGEGALF